MKLMAGIKIRIFTALAAAVAQQAAAINGTTYGAITMGFTYKPEVPATITTLLIRPEVRYDTALSGGKPYNDQKTAGAFFFGADVILGF